MKLSDTVLIMEPNSTVLNLVTRILETRNHFVIGTQSIEEALELCETVHLDLLVCGFDAEHSGNKSVAECVRSRRGVSFRVVYLAGRAGANSADIQKEILEGRSWSIRKPFTLPALLDTVDKALKQKSRPESVGGIQPMRSKNLKQASLDVGRPERTSHQLN